METVMNGMQNSERWAVGLLLFVAMLTFFLPLAALQIPILGDQTWSGYDIFTKIDSFSGQLSSIQSANKTEPAQPQTLPSAPESSAAAATDNVPAMPLSVQMIGLTPFEIALSLACALVCLIFCFGRSRAGCETFSVIGCILAIAAVIQLLIANSDVHSWMQASLKPDQSDFFGALFSGISTLIANSVQLAPGIGLYALASSLAIVVFLLFSGVLKVPAGDLAPTLSVPSSEVPGESSNRFALFIVVAAIIGAAAYYVGCPHHVDSPHRSIGPVVSAAVNAPDVHSEIKQENQDSGMSESELFPWSAQGLPASVVSALRSPDNAPPAGKQIEILISESGERAAVVTDPYSADTCGNIGCAWSVEEASPRHILLSGGYGGLHTISTSTNGYHDLLVENKFSLKLYQYDGAQYQNTRCYTRDDFNGPARTESCTDFSDPQPASPPPSNDEQAPAPIVREPPPTSPNQN